MSTYIPIDKNNRFSDEVKLEATSRPSRADTSIHSHKNARRTFEMSDLSTTVDQVEVATEYLKQWTMGSTAHRALRPKPEFAGLAERNYNLKNKRVRKFLQWEEQTFGINLGWTDDAEPATAKRVMRWFCTRNSRDDKPVRYGETVALGYGIKPSYIYRAHRDVGIDLKWSEAPVFEWKLLGGKAGQEVATGQWVAIYNTKGRECLLEFDRTVGGDIGWPSSQSWADQLGDQLEDLVRDAVRDHWKEAVVALLEL